MTSSQSKNPAVQQLDALTHGAFTAATASERASRIRDWLASGPSVDDMNHVFKELSGRDKGAAKPIRERLDELKRAKGQESLAADWAAKGSALLALPRLNIADALAWQRDAARAGAPLSREPLSSLKAALAERVKGIEDLHHRVMVQKESAVLLAQRIEILSTRPWSDAQAAHELLVADVAQWQQQAEALVRDPVWPSADPKFPPQLEASTAQLRALWMAFEAAIAQAREAATNPEAPLPGVPVWAEELQHARKGAEEPVQKAAKPKVDPEVRIKANESVESVLQVLEAEMALGHGKASAGAANNLRNALREFGRHIDDSLEVRVHAALAAANELEGWQRWRADQLREELVGKARALLNRPEGQALGGRKMQEALRSLREQWKQTDQGGAPNHGLWKRFDEACNEAHKVVEAWVERIKIEAAQHRDQRLSLIEELRTWGKEHAASTDWKQVQRSLNQFVDRWRDAGHVGEKAFAELQKQWNDAIHEAAGPFEHARAHSLEARRALIREAEDLGSAAELHMDAVRSLQQRWQQEAQSVPLDRRQEQKLWDAFRKPIDDAFQRKTQERERAAAQRMAQMSERDRMVLEASRQLEAATASGDTQRVKAAMAGLEAAMRGEAPRAGTPSGSTAASAPGAAPAMSAEAATLATEVVTGDGPVSQKTPEHGQAGDQAIAATVPTRSSRPVVAVRGDDRPGLKRADAASSGARRGPGDRGTERGPGRGDARRSEGQRPERGRTSGDHGRLHEARPGHERGPRLGDEAFRAQREAIEKAEQALRKLAAQAHGDLVMGVLAAWEKRTPDLLPAAQALSRQMDSSARAAWVRALGQPADGSAQNADALTLRLEVAAEVPTPAQFQADRRALQLVLLTRRHEPAPAETWAKDLASLFSTPYEAERARRVQAVLKALFKR